MPSAFSRCAFSAFTGIAVVCLSLFVNPLVPSAFSQQAGFSTSPILEKGVIVESITENQEGEKAGIRPGDALLSWSRGDAKGEIQSPFDLHVIRTEQASRGPLRLIGLRGSAKRSWLVGSDQWGLLTRPNLQGELLSIYERGQQLTHAGKLDEALEQWHRGAAVAKGADIPWLDSWFLSQAAQMYGGQSEKSDVLFAQAIEEATSAAPQVREDLFRQRAESCWQRGDFTHMEAYHKQRLVELQKLGSEMAVSDVLLSLSWVTWRQGDYIEAEKYVREALRIARADGPKSVETVIALHMLGVILWNRGELAAAEEYDRQALDNVERYFPTSNHVAQMLNERGIVAYGRGELAKAQTYFERALSVVERVAPESATVPDTLNKLAECLIDQGRLAIAQRYELRALAIWQKETPGSLTLATSLRNLGKIARIRGDLVRADKYYQQALAIGEREAPQSEETARFLIGLGYVARDRGEPVLAETYFRKALAIIDKSAPNNLNHAETLADLAGVLHSQQKLDEAAKTYQQALAELEDRGSHWGGPDDERSHYRAYHAAYYKRYVDLLVQQTQPEHAFEAVEASRARTLLEMLSESQIDIHQGADSILLAREQELSRSLTAKSQYRIQMLSGKHTDEDMSRLNQEISDLKDQIAQVRAEMRAASPQFAALTQPEPVSATQIQQMLDPETVLLEYSLGEERSYVWVVTDHSLAVYKLPSRAKLEAVVRHLYWYLTARTRREGTDVDSEMANWARSDARAYRLAVGLSRTLLGPVANLIKAKRLLIVSDGALQYIPFSALPNPANTTEPLIVEHEIVNLPSASVLSEIRRANADRPAASGEVAVLADPVFDASDDRVNSASNGPTQQPGLTLPSQTVRRSARDVGLTEKQGIYLGRLIYSRDEAKAILAVAPHAKALEALDFEASREIALSPELAHYRIVHFATHGFLDSKRPELSGLVLSLVNRQGKPQDGFLGLEDVYNLKLPIDMVVLSGCQTGLGEDISGEGLIGLTRGFMYAGASRVVASLWSVDDFTTSQLMAKFYRGIERDKMPPASALRKAQIEMWKHTGWQAPYYWAAFQLQGEWR